MRAIRLFQFLSLSVFLLGGFTLYAQPAAEIEIIQGLCPGISNAVLEVRISGGQGPYDVLWNTGAEESTILGVGPGNYSVTVSDSQGDETTTSVALVDPGSFELTFDLQGCDAPFTVTAIGSGGTPPYRYKWEHTQEGATVSFPEPGTYCVTMTDGTPGNPCGIEGCITIPDLDPVAVGVEATDVTCPGATDGRVEASGQGGTTPYVYEWDTGANTAVIDGLSPGIYFVTVTDANGCTATSSGTVADQVPMQLDIAATHPSCRGESSGVATAMAAGGTPPYSYAWSNGEQNAVVENLAGGNYEVTVTDANGCAIIKDITLIPVSQLEIEISIDNESCPGESDGVLSVSATGGITPLEYFWSTGVTGVPLLSELSPGNYRVTVSDNLGCTVEEEARIQAAAELVFDIDSEDVNDCDSADGRAEVTVISGQGPFAYAWNNGEDGKTIEGLQEGTYTVTVTDGNGCSGSSSVSIAAPPKLEIGIDGVDLVCPGTSQGNLTVDIKAGTPPYAITWSNGSVDETIGNLSAGNFSVTVTDLNGCSASASAQVAEWPEMSASITSDLIVCAGNTGAASVQVEGGNPPYAYQWSHGATTATVTGLAPGNYTLTITDANLCQLVRGVTVNAVTDLELELVVEDVDCNSASSGRVEALVTGGKQPFAYSWGDGQSTSSINELPAGTYGLTVTDDNGCTVSASATVTEPGPLRSGIIGSALLCAGDANGQVTVNPSGGTVPYAYRWDDGSTSDIITGLPAGVYSVTITDANDCSISASMTLNDPVPLLAEPRVNDVLCEGAGTGEIRANVSGGNEPYRYNWSNGVTDRDWVFGLTAGEYFLTVTDATNCILEVGPIVVDEIPAMQLVLNAGNIECSTEPLGTVEAIVSGGTPPYSYTWSNGGTGDHIDALAAGTYFLTVADANNCRVTGQATVDQSFGFTVDINAVDPDCGTMGNGSAEAVPNGGQAPYSFTWSNGETTSSIAGLSPGAYAVTVTDLNGCMAFAAADLAEEPPFVLDFTDFPPTCFGGNDGRISVAVAGGNGPFTYSWNNGEDRAKLDGLAAGTYRVTVTDDLGCEVTAELILPEADRILIEAEIAHGDCDGNENGEISLSLSGGSPPYALLWSNGSMDTELSGLATGDYTVTVADFNGCTEEATFSILEYDALNCFITVTEFVNTGSDGALRADPIGGVGPYQYAWSNGADTREIRDLPNGNYSVTITDDNGCTSSCGFSLIPQTGLGDYVWEDTDRDGRQEDGEAPISGVKVYLKDDLNIIIDSTITDAEGYYYFIGLLPGTYSVQFKAPEDYRLTIANQGDDALDSDATEDSNGMTHQVTLMENQIDSTLDAGFYPKPMGNIPMACGCLDNAHNGGDGQFLEMLTIIGLPNEIWQVVSAQQVFAEDSPAPPQAPVPVVEGELMTESNPGQYIFPLRIIDGIPYHIIFSNGIDQVEFSNVCTYPAINLSEPITDKICITDDPVVLSSSPVLPGAVSYQIDDLPKFILDPGQLGTGAHELVTTFEPVDPEECVAVIRTTIEITDDCFAKIGDKVWWDKNMDGFQGGGEDGLEGVVITVTSPDDPDFLVELTSDMEGMYMATVPPGQSYKVTFAAPVDFMPSPQDRGTNDLRDSDIDPETGMTDVFFVANEEQNFSIDAGFYRVCDNVTDPGKIGYDQVLCGPGNDPDPIQSLEPGSGGTGEIEYLWMKSTAGGVFNPSSWIVINNSNSASYDPGPVFQTTYFARCVRREGCVNLLESNVVGVIVGDDATAEILEPKTICVGEELTFVAAGKGDGDHIQWDFGPRAEPRYVSGNPARVVLTSFGLYKVILQVTENNCTATAEKRIATTNSPTQCESTVVVDLDIMEGGDILLKWQMETPDTYTYEIEHSKEGNIYEKIGSISHPSYSVDKARYFQFVDRGAKSGYNYYRLHIVDEWGNEAYSEVAEGVVYRDSKFMTIFPNPVREELHLEILDPQEREMTIDLIDARGIRLEKFQVAPGTKFVQLEFDQYHSGVYFLNVHVGSEVLKVLKVLKE